MARFQRLIRFEDEHGNTFFADSGSTNPTIGTSIKAYRSWEDILEDANATTTCITKLLPPLPRTDLPIYCVGLNYKSHAKEASLRVPANPPVWTKPVASLAGPDEIIPISRYCASYLPDWEGELVFVTACECRDVSPEEAASCILGYTVGNDLSCRFFQLPEQTGGQFFYAKAFDNFAPIGPALIHADLFTKVKKTAHLTTRINGQVKQNARIADDMIYDPAKVLSWMSQSTTIPAYTAVMTGTPAGVGAFQSPRQFLQHGDIVEVEITGVGTLKNEIRFEEGQNTIL